jgi:hypothetical protein
MNAFTMSQYEYSPLPSESHSIRLLRLMPYDNKSTTTSEIECELFEYSLQDQSKGTHLYEALSYAWGSLEKPCSISIKKENLAVTNNLHSALLRLRDRALERVLWVDAVCIDQDNNEERKHQVELMAKIYSNAHRVIVWLGEGGGNVEGALEDIRLAADEESIEGPENDINQEGIRELLGQEWFQRIWVRE